MSCLRLVTLHNRHKGFRGTPLGKGILSRLVLRKPWLEKRAFGTDVMTTSRASVLSQDARDLEINRLSES